MAVQFAYIALSHHACLWILGGSIWKPPPMHPYTQGMPDELVEGEEKEPRKGSLSNTYVDLVILSIFTLVLWCWNSLPIVLCKRPIIYMATIVLCVLLSNDSTPVAHMWSFSVYHEVHWWLMHSHSLRTMRYTSGSHVVIHYVLWGTPLANAWSFTMYHEVHQWPYGQLKIIQSGSNMTGTICV